MSKKIKITGMFDRYCKNYGSLETSFQTLFRNKDAGKLWEVTLLPPWLNEIWPFLFDPGLSMQLISFLHENSYPEFGRGKDIVSRYLRLLSASTFSLPNPELDFSGEFKDGVYYVNVSSEELRGIFGIPNRRLKNLVRVLMELNVIAVPDNDCLNFNQIGIRYASAAFIFGTDAGMHNYLIDSRACEVHSHRNLGLSTINGIEHLWKIDATNQKINLIGEDATIAAFHEYLEAQVKNLIPINGHEKLLRSKHGIPRRAA